MFGKRIELLIDPLGSVIGQLGLGTEREQVPWVVLEGLDGFHSSLWVDGVKPHKSILSQDLWLRRFAFVSPVDGHSAGHQALEDLLCHIPGIAAVFNGQIEPAIFEETLFSVPVARLKQIGVLLPFPSGEHVPKGDKADLAWARMPAPPAK